MEKHDRIIAELMDALDMIQREARKTDGSLAYIDGVTMGAMARVNAERVRNADGYLVVAGAK